MSEGTKHRWGIVFLAVMMFFITMIVTVINGNKTSLYYAVWVATGYYAYKNNLAAIKGIMQVLIWLNICVLILVLVLVDSTLGNEKLQLAVGILVMLVPKIFLYHFAKTNIDFHYSESVTSSSENFNEANSKMQTTSNKFVISNASEKKEEELWELALNEFESANRKNGLYAKLFSLHNGDEKKIKSSYIKERFEQLKIEQVEKNEKQNLLRKKYDKNQSAEDCIRNGNYTSKFYKDVECLLFANGQAAIKINEKKFRLYENDSSVDKSLKYYLGNGMYLTTGLMRVIEFDEEKIIISCPRCKQKTKVPKNKELEISCPSCDFKWIEKT